MKLKLTGRIGQKNYQYNDFPIIVCFKDIFIIYIIWKLGDLRVMIKINNCQFKKNDYALPVTLFGNNNVGILLLTHNIYHLTGHQDL